MKNISKNRFGFTLVELLAVIVILAIIAVIAVPSVLKIISGARNDSVKVSARSAIKAADLAATKGETEGDLTALDIDKNPFKGGSWYYDKTLKKVIIYEARDKEAIADSKYVITGDIEQINSDDFVVSKPANDNSKLLANKFKFGEFGYLTGVQINNYVQFGNLGEQPLIWRVVKLFEDKSVQESVQIILLMLI